MSDRGREDIEMRNGNLRDREVLYGERLSYPVWLTNTRQDLLVVRAVSVRLESENGWRGDGSRFVFRHESGIELPPGQSKIWTIPIRPTLDCLENSNNPSVAVEYSAIASSRRRGIRQSQWHRGTWIVVKEVPPPDAAEVFVSFKDPENEELAQLAARYLRRAGLAPYLARDDEQCGRAYWEGKIMPAIVRSSGVLVIWSPDVVRSPDAVRREMGIAQRARVPLGLFLSRDVEAPVEYPPSVLEYVCFDPGAPHAAFADGIADMARRWRETGQCF